MFKGKITIVGAGFVGSTTAYTIMLKSIADEIVLIDIDSKKAEGEVLDMLHGASFVSPIKIVTGDYSAAVNSDIVIITAGANQKPNETRIDLVKKNTAVFKDILSKLLPHCSEKTIIMVVTNPVDILTFVTQKISSLPQSRVFGSGTVLDTSRLKYLLSQKTNVDPRNIHAYIIGEHGDTELASWSSSSIGGLDIKSFCKKCERCKEKNGICIEETFNEVKNAGYSIIEKKGATFYAIAMAVNRIVECILGNEHSVLTVSSKLQGEYGINDVCLSLPTVVDMHGIDKIIETELSDSEIKGLRYSADSLKSVIKEIGF